MLYIYTCQYFSFMCQEEMIGHVDVALLSGRRGFGSPNWDKSSSEGVVVRERQPCHLHKRLCWFHRSGREEQCHPQGPAFHQGQLLGLASGYRGRPWRRELLGHIQTCTRTAHLRPVLERKHRCWSKIPTKLEEYIEWGVQHQAWLLCCSSRRNVYRTKPLI